MYKIVRKEVLNETVELMEVIAPFVARKCEPGQFIMLCVEPDGERIPLTIADFDRERETVTIIYQVVGYSTRKLSEKNVGDSIEEFVGPLGKAAPLPSAKKVLGIGGGVGIAPLYPQLRKLKENGADVDCILGGQNKDYIIMKDQMEAICANVHYASDDGSIGSKGFVTTPLEKLLDEGESYDLVIAIGPLPMMKAICHITKKHNIKTNVSLNPIMIDGTGMCGGCRVTVGNETKFACVDGPDFDGHLVDFDEAMLRQGMYKEEEHKCRLERK
ncbi:MAG: sulfide/dihydroorotate dehydrogenase-like FAD/NAD-binding protein [Epulopiscium sp.]|nr:sulfide/dihydroorotate dehydrogenase-like FAD/NAD-binding protein [Candidatus Epulonipiscium sp.]